MANLECIPFAGFVMRAVGVLENCPSKHRGAIKAGKPQLAAGGIKPVMLFFAICAEYQPSRASLIIKFDHHFQFVGQRGRLEVGEAKGASAKPRATLLHGDPPGALAPLGAHQGFPFLAV